MAEVLCTQCGELCRPYAEKSRLHFRHINGFGMPDILEGEIGECELRTYEPAEEISIPELLKRLNPGVLTNP